MNIGDEDEALAVTALPHGAVERARLVVAAHAHSGPDRDLLLEALGLRTTDNNAGRRCPTCGTRHHRRGPRRRHHYCSRNCYDQSPQPPHQPTAVPLS